jgi:DNA modification methylase
LSKAQWIGPERGRFSFVSDEDARWIALFLETEGNVCIKRSIYNGQTRYGCQLAIANSFRPLLEKLTDITKTGTILERKGKNWPVYYWQVSNKVGRDLLYRIYPFLIAKRRQARIAIYQESLLYYRGGLTPERKFRTKEESNLLEKLWIDLKACNKGKTPDISYVPEVKYGHWASQKYYYDAEAIKEPVSISTKERWGESGQTRINPKSGKSVDGESTCGFDPSGRNRRSVWTITTKPFKEAHFATFPEDLVEPMILAGTSEKGVCPECGKPWKRKTEKKETPSRSVSTAGPTGDHGFLGNNRRDIPNQINTLGWQPTCDCGDLIKPVPSIVLDPFSGAGTTCVVAKKLLRNYIGIELNPQYCKMSEARINKTLAQENFI